jgi:hypothetical protein
MKKHEKKESKAFEKKEEMAKRMKNRAPEEDGKIGKERDEEGK